MIIDNQTSDPAHDPLTENIQQPTDGQMVLLNMEALVKQHLSATDKAKEELETSRGMLNDILANDILFKEHDQAVKDATKIRNQTKAQILKIAQAAQLADKVHSLSTEIKELKGATSDYAKEYTRITGANEIEGASGEIFDIVTSAKLIKKPVGNGWKPKG